MFGLMGNRVKLAYLFYFIFLNFWHMHECIIHHFHVLIKLSFSFINLFHILIQHSLQNNFFAEHSLQNN